MTKTLSVLALTALAGTTHADLITWTFGAAVVGNGGSVNSTVGGGITGIPSLTRSNGGTGNLVETNSVSTLPGTSGTGNGAAAAVTGPINTTNSSRFTWTITPNAYTSLLINSIAFGSRSTSTGPTGWSLRSDADSYAAGIASGTMTANSAWAQQSGSPAFALNAATTFRLYGFGGTGTVNSNNWRIDDLILNYTVRDSAINASTPVNAGQIRRSTIGTATMAMNEVAGGVQASTGFSISGGSAEIALSTAAAGTIADGATVNNGLTITSATAGAYSTSFTIANTGNGADTDRAGVNHTVNVNADIVDGSTASFDGSGLVTTALINFGTVNQGDSVAPVNFQIHNLLQTLGYTAGLDILAGDVAAAGDVGTFLIYNVLQSDLTAGTTGTGFATFDTSVQGIFSATFTILGRDAAAVQGGMANDNTLTLTITGSVVPTPGSAALLGIGMIAAGRRRRA